MPDKEFDKLFQQKFDSFETEPSQDLWVEISQTLHPVKEKSKIRPYWMAAASIVAVVAFGWWLNLPQEKVRLYGSKEQKPSKQILKPEPKTATQPLKEETIEVASIQAVDKKAVAPVVEIGIKKKEMLVNTEVLPAKLIDKEEPVKSDEPLITIEKVADNKTTEPLTPQTTETVLALAETPLESMAEEESKPQLRNIKSVGGLVNFVVSKVDKRKDKIIEFTDTDEGSIVSGLNLGFVKIKSRN
ncbi:hypothetical protein [Rubrolithibacter danxiaensis]|uniref:hypothetical protein n=1 Tax=Rubrolithibacter danxiaensis TaxID=3390805 RepID=UPI003BF8D719